MASHPPLSVGVCHALHHGIEPLPDHLKNPVVQVIDVKRISPSPNQAGQGERFRLVISDGVHFIQAMVTTQINGMVKSNQVQNRAIIRINDFICNTVHDKRIAIILNMEVVAPPTSATIGHPAPVDGTKANEPPSAQAHPGPAAPKQSAPRPSQPRPQIAPKPAQPHIDPSNAQLTEIRNLNPYLPKWTFRARVTNKTELRPWTSNKGSGKLFSVDLLDESGEIKATMFNEAADHFYGEFQVGEVYIISKGTLKFANKKYTSVNNEFELSLDLNSTVQRVADSSVGAAMPKMHFKFVPIADIQDKQKDDIVDAIGVIVEVKPFSSITTKAGNQLAKREIDIVDDSHRGIQVTLWGERAEHFMGERNQVLAIKAAKVSEYGGQKNLSALQSSVIDLNPDNERAISLRTWMDSTDQASLRSMVPTGSSSGGSGRSFPDHTLAEAAAMNVYGKADYLTVRATVMSIKTDKTVFYKSCPGNNCMRRVSGEDGHYTCDRCGKTYDRCNMRYVVSMSIADDTGSQWASAFNDAATTIFNVDANDMAYRKESDPARFDATVEAARYTTFNFRASIAQEEWEGQSRMRMKLLNAQPLDYVAESRKLIAKIHALQSQ